ncbi:MAG: VWA domain-containing protein [Desulfococcaceae bacterium]|nr:VWA domain-containing protein [Desulfococcaceae bacterium]
MEKILEFLIAVNHNPLMILLHPYWLILLIPAAALLLYRKMPSRPLSALRTGILILLVLALCRPALRLESRSGTLVILADRSKSMPVQSPAAMQESISLVRSGMTENDVLAVISFGQQTAVERGPLPASGGEFSGFMADVGTEQSDIASALEKALALIPLESPGRILLLSDGRYTGSDPRRQAALAAARGIAADFRYLGRDTGGDTAIVQINAPDTLHPGQSFILRAEILSPAAQELKYTLYRENSPVASGKKTFSAGSTCLMFRDRAEAAGVQAYTLQISAADRESPEDPVPENNRAKLLLGIQGPLPLLHTAPGAGSALLSLLRKSRSDVRSVPPEKFSWSLEDLSRYAAVILENIPADSIAYPGMENIAAWLKHSGAGLMLTGGMNAYGSGGYFRSPLEEELPVSMELRNEHRKMRLAIVIVLDRSGSMSMKAEGGRTKMDLANIGAVQVLDLLSPFDEFGLIAVDSSPHEIVRIKSADQADAERGKILSIDAGGGGIFVYSGLRAAAEMLLQARAETRHIILFADAADAEEPGEYKSLIEKCVKAGISISVIGLGTPEDRDAALLEDIAVTGGGRSFFTVHPQEIPRLFAQDTFSVARSAFVQEKTALRPLTPLSAMSDMSFGAFPKIGGYNLCYIRPRAAQALMSDDEYQAPVLAYWHRGKGRVLCYTGEAGGEYTGPLGSWPRAGDFFSSLARWTAGEQGTLPDNMLLDGERDKGIFRIQLHLDPELVFSESPKVNMLRGIPGKSPKQENRIMQRTAADTFSLEIPMDSSETLLPSVHIPGFPVQNLSPICLPYSPEYLPSRNQREGKEILEEIARISGGKERIRLAEIWKDLPEIRQHREIAPWLILAALSLFLPEIFLRRTRGIHFRIFTKVRPPGKADKSPETGPETKKKFRKIKKKEEKAGHVPPEKVHKKEERGNTGEDDTFTAMQRAKKKAEERTKVGRE